MLGYLSKVKLDNLLFCFKFGRKLRTYFAQVFTKSKKSNLHYTRLIPFRVSRVGGAHLRSFARNGGESLATCGRFDRLGI